MSRFNDLTGQTFGCWTVLHLFSRGGGDRTKWWCICSCDLKTEREVDAYRLTSGHSTSCGCFQKKQVSAVRSSDLVGQVFGNLTVLAKTDERKNGSIVWLCFCDACGKEKNFSTQDLTSGDSKSCGCKSTNKILDLTGQTYGLLFVDHLVSREGAGSVWWCICKCGKELPVRMCALRQKDGKGQQSCGCQKGKNRKTNKGQPIVKPQIGQRFGFLVFQGIIEERNKYNSRLSLWLCDCGQTIKKTISQVIGKRGYRSCGRGCPCVERKKSSKFRDLTGQTFGSLYVDHLVSRANKCGPDGKPISTIWWCICGLCDNGWPVRLRDIVRTDGRAILSCGCEKRKPEIGQRFNCLIYRGKTGERDNSGKLLGYFDCDCGESMKAIVISSVKSGNTTSCGCENKRKIGDRKRLKIAVGFKINRLTLVKICNTRSLKGEVLGLWDCDCGSEGAKNRVYPIWRVLRGTPASCGCLRRETAATAMARGQAAWNESGDTFLTNLRIAVEGGKRFDFESKEKPLSPADIGGADVQ